MTSINRGCHLIRDIAASTPYCCSSEAHRPLQCKNVVQYPLEMPPFSNPPSLIPSSSSQMGSVRRCCGAGIRLLSRESDSFPLAVPEVWFLTVIKLTAHDRRVLAKVNTNNRILHSPTTTPRPDPSVIRGASVDATPRTLPYS
jgi:hypothetical protein